MRITFKLHEDKKSIFNPEASVRYSPEKNQIRFHQQDGNIVWVELDGIDFTLHEDVKPDVKVGQISGVTTLPYQIPNALISPNASISPNKLTDAKVAKEKVPMTIGRMIDLAFEALEAKQ